MKKVTNIWSEQVPVPLMKGKSVGYYPLDPGMSLIVADEELVEKEIRRLEKKGRLEVVEEIREIEEILKDGSKEEVLEDEEIEDIEELEQKLLAEDPEDPDE